MHHCMGQGNGEAGEEMMMTMIKNNNSPKMEVKERKEVEKEECGTGE
jgi:hypothetical protein